MSTRGDYADAPSDRTRDYAQMGIYFLLVFTAGMMPITLVIGKKESIFFPVYGSKKILATPQF